MRGDGSVYQEVDPRTGDKRWVVQLVVEGRRSPVKRRLSEVTNDKGGKRKATKRDAQTLLRELRGQAARGELETKAKGTEAPKLPTVADVLRQWIDWLPQSAAAPSARTVVCYRRLIRNDLAPTSLGALPIDQVRPGHVVGLFRELAGKGRAASTINKERSILSRAFRWAKLDQRWEEALSGWSDPVPAISRQHMPATKAPKRTRQLTVAETKTLLAATAEDRMWGAWIRLGVDCCARPGELAALTWADLELPTEGKGKVAITKSLAWVPVAGRKGEMPELTDTKTHESGWHTVTISPSTVAALREHRKRQLAEQAALPGYWPTEQDGIDLTNVVFRQADGRLLHEDTTGAAFRRITMAAGIGHAPPKTTRTTGAQFIREHFGPLGPHYADAALGHKPQGTSAALSHYVDQGGTVDSTCLDLVLSNHTERGDQDGAVAL